MVYKLPELEYEFDALEPFIDAKTMEIHHGKHHAAYVQKLNEGLIGFNDYADMDIEDLLKDLDSLPEEIRTAVRNHGGGHVNHSLFWQILKKSIKCEGKIKKAIENGFGSFEDFKKRFGDSAMKRFGSGWVWLVVNSNMGLEIASTANQDSPLSSSMLPILGLDVWEHAYYLKYQNRRAEYVESFWHVVNWKKVNEFYEKALDRFL